MRSWPVLVLVGACFAPRPAPGAPCGLGGECPNGLICAVDGRCELVAGAIDAAPAADGDLLVDAQPHPDGQILHDAPVLADASIDGAGPPKTCWNAWQSGTPVLSAPALVAELSSTTDEGDPSLSGDALTLYFQRGFDLFSAKRPARGAPFAAPVAIAELNSAQEETKLSVSADGLTAVLASKRGILTDSNLYECDRATAGAAFGAPSTTPFPNAIDDVNQQLDPDLSASGLVLYYSNTGIGGLAQGISRTQRTSTGAIFDAPTAVPITDTSGAIADPAVSPDERAILFSTNPPNNDIFLATRATATGTFANPIALTTINSTALDGDPALSRDGCELFFMSNRAGSRALYRATVTPQ